MEQTEYSATPTNMNSIIDSWNQERTLEQLQQFVSGRYDQNTEVLDLV